ncbi:hypothetical protein CFK37_08625 [Virgibacillus phasianinus]|uniref:GFO/IDH/MocA-like oxidoreductase domain-containing protein n=1 Tax=Virgibacillus phasianinus TaxID=2017483 RepID=A0A220U328_9BACI|nr:Gfo/Idh/MocA family oxidoreductase [Virgibacillus phasianinus]ASK62221.1 hypothetical protein CFK37_08625 [Virgibacillus phasianinus]
MLKVAVVGTGSLSDDHYQTWSRLQNVQAERVGNGTTVDVDIIDLCVPVNERPDFIREINKEGIRIVCETVLATNVDEASALMGKCDEKDVHLFVGNRKRFSPEYVDARNQVRDGNIGKPGVIRLSSSAPHPGDDGDIFCSLGVPEFDWLTWTFGNVERVMAKHVKKERKDGSLTEYALLSLRLEDGSFAHVDLSWGDGARETSFELTGDEGMITYNSKESNPINLQLSATPEGIEEDILIKTPLQRMLEYVAVCQDIGEQSLQAMQIAEAARESAKTGQPVSLKEVR